MLTVLTLLKMKPSPNGERHGERPFWRQFGPRYLDAWVRSAHRYLPTPYRIVVMTDTPEVCEGLEVATAPLDKSIDAPGFWAKLNMFRHGQGKTLYCDLDNVINGPLDELCALEPEPLIMLDDKRVPGLPNGSLILFDAKWCRIIWDAYAADREETERTFVAKGDDYSRAYDQAFISEVAQWHGWKVPLFQNLLPEGYILNARSELPNASDWRSARVIFGGGMEKEGKPHTATHPGFALR